MAFRPETVRFIKTVNYTRKLGPGHYVWRKEEVVVDVTVEWEPLCHELALRAAGNGSGRTVEMGGIIRAWVVGRTPIERREYGPGGER